MSFLYLLMSFFSETPQTTIFGELKSLIKRKSGNDYIYLFDSLVITLNLYIGMIGFNTKFISLAMFTLICLCSIDKTTIMNPITTVLNILRKFEQDFSNSIDIQNLEIFTLFSTVVVASLLSSYIAVKLINMALPICLVSTLCFCYIYMLKPILFADAGELFTPLFGIFVIVLIFLITIYINKVFRNIIFAFFFSILGFIGIFISVDQMRKDNTYPFITEIFGSLETIELEIRVCGLFIIILLFIYIQLSLKKK